MGRLSSTGTRRLLRVLALSVVAISGLATWALATGPGGWDHLGDRGTPGSDSLDAAVYALHETPGALYVGGAFTDAGGKTGANRIASWNGSSWSALSSSTAPAAQISNGAVFAIAAAGGKVYAGGTFQNAGGNDDADFLAVWNGASWAPFCNVMQGTATRAFNGNVVALQVIGPNLYVGGSFQDGAGIPSADYLLRCNLNTGVSTTTVVDVPGVPNHPFSGSVYALTADSNETLYAGGLFINLEDNTAADKVAYMDGGGWHSMGSGAPLCGGCAVTGAVRSLAANGTDVYVGTDSTDVAGIPRADHVVKWNGSGWHALGSNTGGANGWFPTSTTIDGLATFGSNVFATGSFQNANGDLRADAIAYFDGSAWHPVGSDGAGNGPLNPSGSALAVFGAPVRLYVGGSFTSAGGDGLARSAASFPLSNLIAVPTPTVTPGPGPVPTPTVTPSPTAPDTTAPRTSLRAARINQAKRKATFRFASGEPGSKFLCKLDKKKYKPCTSPKTYKKLKRGKHVFRVKARDRAGNIDRTPTVKRFKIKR